MYHAQTSEHYNFIEPLKFLVSSCLHYTQCSVLYNLFLIQSVKYFKLIMIDFFIVKTWSTAKCININNLVYRDQLCNNEKKMLVFFFNFNFHFKFFLAKSSCLILFSLSFFVVVAVL